MKSSDLPSRIFSFRVKEITSSIEDVDRQYRLAHEYQNALVAVELKRRQTYRACRSTIPEYAEIERPYLKLEEEIESIREEINLVRQKNRKRVDTPEQNARIAALIAEKRKHKVLLDAAAKKVKGNAELMAVGREADAEAATSSQALRDNYSRQDLGWGTRGMVEAAVQAAKKSDRDPKIHHWNGGGRIGVQLQGTHLSKELKASGHQIKLDQKRLREMRKELEPEGSATQGSATQSKVVRDLTDRLAREKTARYSQKSPENRGLPVSNLATDTRLQIVVPPEIAYQALSTRRGDRRRAARTTGKLRIGSTPARDPVWIEFKVTMHRQLPDDGIIKWAWIKRIMVGTHEVYHLQLVIEAPSFEQKVSISNREEAVAIDVGWRVREKNSLRVAYLLDTAGKHEEILLPTTMVSRIDHAEGLRSTQDTAFDNIKDLFLEWISNNKDNSPPWFKDAFQFLAQSRSPKNLAWNVREWGRRRFAGDSLIYDTMMTWRRQFLHLYEWEVNERAGALAERKNFYHHVALDLARRYHNVLLEDFKMTRIVENAMPEEEADNPQTQRHNRVMSSISEFRQTVSSTCSAWRSRVWQLPAAYTTLDCHACHIEGEKHAEWDPAQQLVHTCREKCGRTWDQDYNASVNLLNRWLKSHSRRRAA